MTKGVKKQVVFQKQVLKKKRKKKKTQKKVEHFGSILLLLE